jgi:isoquinoline 1-oxidoreductase
MSAEIARRPAPDRGQSGITPRPPDSEDIPEIGAWLHFEHDGIVTVYCGKAEVGQSLRASLGQAVAEELRVAVDRVRVVLGDTDATPFDLGTFGSRTTPVLAARLHKVAASARELFVARAAALWSVPADTLVVAAGQVRHQPTGRAAGYAELAGDQPLAEHWREDVLITAPADWTAAGRPVPRWQAPRW